MTRTSPLRDGATYFINPKLAAKGVPKNPEPPPEATDKADRSPPTLPSGGSVSAQSGHYADFDPTTNQGSTPPSPDDADEEGTWTA